MSGEAGREAAAEVHRLLATHIFLAGLEAEHLASLAECAREVRFPAGALILREGGAADTLYLLVEGHVVLEVAARGKPPMRVESLGAGEILGLHWLFPPRRWVLDARATEPVRAVALEADGLRARMEGDARLGYALSTRLLRQLYERLERVRLQRLDVYAADAR